MGLLGIPRKHVGLVVLAWIGGAVALGWTLVFAQSSLASVWGLSAVGFAIVLALVFAEQRAALFPIAYAVMWIPFAFVLLAMRSPPFFAFFLFSVLPYTWGPYLLGLPLAIVRTAEALGSAPSDVARAQT